jgi:hypothetical protein
MANRAPVYWAMPQAAAPVADLGLTPIAGPMLDGPSIAHQDKALIAEHFPAKLADAVGIIAIEIAHHDSPPPVVGTSWGS